MAGTMAADPKTIRWRGASASKRRESNLEALAARCEKNGMTELFNWASQHNAAKWSG